MAGPHAAGVAALALSAHPGMKPGALASLLERTATALRAPWACTSRARATRRPAPVASATASTEPATSTRSTSCTNGLQRMTREGPDLMVRPLVRAARVAHGPRKAPRDKVECDSQTNQHPSPRRRSPTNPRCGRRSPRPTAHPSRRSSRDIRRRRSPGPSSPTSPTPRATPSSRSPSPPSPSTSPASSSPQSGWQPGDRRAVVRRAQPRLPARPRRAAPRRRSRLGLDDQAARLAEELASADAEAPARIASEFTPTQLMPIVASDRASTSRATGIRSHSRRRRSPNPPPSTRQERTDMPAAVLIGAQWGDEGKGKATDLLGSRARLRREVQRRQQRRPHRRHRRREVRPAPAAVGHPHAGRHAGHRQRRRRRHRGAVRGARGARAPAASTSRSCASAPTRTSSRSTTARSTRSPSASSASARSAPPAAASAPPTPTRSTASASASRTSSTRTSCGRRSRARSTRRTTCS